MSLGEMKKNALLEFFKEAVRADLRQDSARAQRAYNQAKAVGVTDEDIQWLSKFVEEGKGKEFKKVFGENALGLDLEERMEDHDAILKGFQYSPRYVSFYQK
jgi:hypothetical protein